MEAWVKDLRTIEERLRSDSLIPFLDDPAVSFVEKRARLDRTWPAGVSQGPRNFVLFLARENQVKLLGTVADEFERLVKRRLTAQVAWVTSAVPLTKSEQVVLAKQFKARFGEGLELRFNVDASLLGGVVIRVGDQVIDGSLAGKLDALRERLTQNR
jgi:F-type H+-transporting ATPase subunit delta